MDRLEGISFKKPFPHLIVENYYNQKELELVWEELRFLTKPGKLFEAKDYGGIEDRTNSHALILDEVYRKTNSGPNYRDLSNILTVNRKLFTSEVLDIFGKIDDCCCTAPLSNWDVTKVRYYHNEEYYEPHTDKSMMFLAFYYTYREPRKFTGGEVYFPKYDYQPPLLNNSMIIMPGWVEHAVKKVSIKDSDYYDGWGRYCISSFFGSVSKSKK